MKIAYVSNYLPHSHTHAGGAEAALMETARLAESCGHEPFFLTLAPDKDKGAYAGTRMSVSVLERYLPFIRKPLEILKWYVFSFDPVAYFSCRRILRAIRPDIVHCGNIQFLTFAVVLAARHEKIPVFLSVYDYWYFCPLTTLFDSQNRCCRKFHGTGCVVCLPRKFRLIQLFLLAARKRVFDYFLARIERFIVLSKSSLSILAAYGIPREKIRVIPHVVSPGECPRQVGGPKQRYVLFVGWLQKRKGLHVLLEAMRAVWQKRDDVELRVIVQNVKWEDEYRAAVEAAFAAIGDRRLRVYRGPQEKSFIRGMIAGAALVVVPEQWENMSPIIIMEAMQCGTCVVASDIGGVGEFIRHGVDGFLARSGDPSDFADRILFALDNPQDCMRCGTSARQRIAELSDHDVLSQNLSREYEQWKKR